MVRLLLLALLILLDSNELLFNFLNAPLQLQYLHLLLILLSSP